MIEQKIETLLLEKFKEEAFQDCFVVEIKLHTNNKLEVFIDSDSRLTFKKCQQISRFLESYLDEEKWIGEKYTLDVSSPGIGRPLTFLRQYIKNIDRSVAITLIDKQVQKGKLIAADSQNIKLEQTITVKEGKKKRKEVIETIIPFSSIDKTIVKITF